jgi:hypothetical protein
MSLITGREQQEQQCREHRAAPPPHLLGCRCRLRAFSKVKPLHVQLQLNWRVESEVAGVDGTNIPGRMRVTV